MAITALNPLRIARAKVACAPRWITIFVTNYCNARCEHCFYWNELNSKAPELSADDLGRVFESIQKPVHTVRLSGGEPFLRKDLEDVILAADATGKIRTMSIPTHGMIRNLPSRINALVPRLKHLHLNVSVSFDGLRDRHDANRKIRGGFDLAIRNLQELHGCEQQFRLFSRSASVSLTPAIALAEADRPPEVLALFEFLRRETGVEEIGCDHIRSAETDVLGLPPEICSGFAPPPSAEDAPRVRNRRHSDVLLSNDEKARVNEALAAEFSTRAGRLTRMRLDKQVEIGRSPRRLVDCLAGFVDCVIYPSGDVAVCEFSKPFANLHDFGMDLMRVMTSNQAIQGRAMTRACSCTHPCHLSDSLAYDTEFIVRFLDS